MKKIQTLIAACALMLVSFSSSVMSDSSNFAGPYIGLQGSTVGVGVDGKQLGGSDDVNATTDAPVGYTGIVAGVEAGYAIPLGSMFLLDIGGSYIDGAARMSTQTSDTVSVETVKFVVSQFYTGYIAPTLVLSDTSSLYVKIAKSDAAVDVTTTEVTNPGDLNGDTYAIGTRTVLDSGIFIRAEAGYTDYDNITSRGTGNGKIATRTTYEADPTIAYGAISLGFRF